MLQRYLKILADLKEGKYSELVEQKQQLILNKLNSELFSSELHRYLASMNAVGVPFTDFDHEPAPVSQVKKFYNALHHAKCALQEAEAVDLSGMLGISISSLSGLYSNTLKHIYEAGYLATHLDVNYFEVFKEEIDVLAPLLQKFRGYAVSYQAQAKGMWAKMDHDLHTRIGREIGVFVNQLDPKDGEPDYEFLAMFGAELPRYLDELTVYIEKFSSNVSEHEPNLDVKRLDELQVHAVKLLNALDGARGSNLFLPLQTLHYIHVIRHTITLAMSIFEQAGHLTETTQKEVRTKLDELKTLLAKVHGVTDKIAEQAMLNSRTLSKPLTEKVSKLYETIIKYAKKFVDFSGNGQALLTLEDSGFLAKRLEDAYGRLAAEQNALLVLDETSNEARKFFEILEQQAARNAQLMGLSPETKQQLAKHYQVFRPYVRQLDVSLDDDIVNALSPTVVATGFLARKIKVNQVLSQRDKLEPIFAKKRVSHDFQIKLNAIIRNSVSHDVQELRLSPGIAIENPFKIDETVVFSKQELENRELTFTTVIENNLEKKRLVALDVLTAAQVESLHKLYQIKRAKLEEAHKAYQEFRRILTSPVAEGGRLERKRILRNLYTTIQPYLISKLPVRDPDMDVVDVQFDTLLDLDKALVAALSINDNESRSIGQTGHVIATINAIEGRFTSTRQYLTERCDVFDTALRESTCKEMRSKPLVIESAPRAHHVIKHLEFSKAVKQLREYLNKQIPLFNETVKRQLEQRPGGEVPYPDIEDVTKTLEQSSQVVMYKQVFNLLHYLEQIIAILEKLDDKSYTETYAIQIMQLGDNLIRAFLITQSLAGTPYFSAIVAEIQKKLQQVQTTLVGLQTYYIPEPTTPPDAAAAHPEEPVLPVEEPAGHTPIFLTMNALLFLPAHIRALKVNQPVGPDAAREIHAYAEKVTADLERILAKSGSYLKLSTEVLTMYHLFGDLKVKLSECASTSYDSVFKNLEHIHDEIFNRIRLELDLCEDNLGLKPGILVEPIDAIFDAFFKGLLEPLKLDSKERIKLMASTRSLKNRIEAATQRAEVANRQKEGVIEDRQILENFLRSLSDYNHQVVFANQMPTTTQADMLSVSKIQLISVFQNALPILKRAQDRLNPDIKPGGEAEANLDAMLNGDVAEEEKLKNIEALTIACINYLRGLRASHELTYNTAIEKIAYLNDKLLAQPELKVHLVDIYTKASFDKKKALALAAHRVDLRDSKLCEEYEAALVKYLNEAENTILLRAKDQDDIDKKLDELVYDKIAEFRRAHYNSYRHMDGILGAVARLQRYVVNPLDSLGVPRQLDESYRLPTAADRKPTGTLQRKINHLSALEKMVKDNKGIACFLLKVARDPVQAGFEEIVAQLHATNDAILSSKDKELYNALLLHENELYFVDVVKKEIRKIEVSSHKRDYADKLKQAFADTYKLANTEELYLVNSLRGRTPIIDDRITNIKKYLLHDSKNSFKADMNEHRHHTVFTWNWLKQCVVWLFEKVFMVYTPERKAIYNDILTTVKAEPSYYQRLNFFQAARENDRPVLAPIRAEVPALA